MFSFEMLLCAFVIFISFLYLLKCVYIIFIVLHFNCSYFFLFVSKSKSLGLFVAIDNNTLCGSKLSLFFYAKNH